jgi:hypothetical protein
MRFLRLAMFGGLAYGAWRVLRGATGGARAAFAEGQGAKGNTVQVRDAGPEAMRDSPNGEWSMVDEQSDESFPASDPPGNY